MGEAFKDYADLSENRAQKRYHASVVMMVWSLCISAIFGFLKKIPWIYSA